MKNYLILLFMSAIVFPATGQDKVGILTNSPLGTLDIHRGTANEGTLVARGTNYPSHFNYSTTENTFIRGGKFGSHVLINDQPQSGNVGIGILTTPLQKLHIGGSAYITDNLGLGISDPLQKLHVAGSTYITDKLGLGVAAPNGTLQFANTAINRKIVLWESINNDHQFYGLGINGNMMRYQVAGTNDSHAFFAGNAIPNSTELMRIKGDGSVAIGTPSPDNSALLQLNSTTRGLLIPRMNTLQRNAIVSPEPGLMILNLDDQCIDIYDGTNWIKNCGLKITGTETIPEIWATVADFGGTERYGAFAFSIGGKGYMGTGFDFNGSYKNDFWEYNPATNIWTQKANASSTPRSSAVGITITGTQGERGYMGTGNNLSTYFNDWWEYNPAGNSWTLKSPFPGSPRAEAVGVATGNFGYVGTGVNSLNDPSADMWRYNANDNSWEGISNLPYETFGAVGFSLGGDIFIGTGGTGGDENTNSFYKYNNSVWTEEYDLPGGGRNDAVAFVINGEAYVGTGFTTTYKKDIWKYAPQAMGWIQQSDFPGAERAYAVAFTINNKSYIGTGYSIQNGHEGDLHVYAPSQIANEYSSPGLPEPVYSVDDGLWVRVNDVVHPSNPDSSMLGIGLTNAINRLDINTGTARTGNHATGRSLYVTGPLSSASDGIEFRHSNGTQGIGFGYNTIYATGSDANQSLGLSARGVIGALSFATNGVLRMHINGSGNIGIGTASPLQKLHVAGNAYISDNVGIGTTSPVQKLQVVGNANITGNVGIGVNTPNGLLQFPNANQNRKIVLYEAANNDYQFFGFGTGGGELRYHVNSPADHVFYKGHSGGIVEQMRIRDNGNVDVSGTVEMGWEIKTVTQQIPPSFTSTVSCNCTSPKKVIGGGASANLDNAVLIESYPSTDSQWTAVYKNQAGPFVDITVYAICARIGD